MSLSIIILTYNSELCIQPCLESVLNECSSMQSEIIVVDNNSSDSTKEIIVKKFPTVKLIQNCTNQGVAKARNIGIQYSSGEYILILDDDVIVQNNSIKMLLNFIKNNENTGVVGPQLENPDGSIQYNGLEVPTFKNKLKRVLNKLLQLHRPNKYEKQILTKEAYQPGYLIGAVQLTKRSIFNRVGLLDEKIFYGPEDADFCMRVRACNFDIVCLPIARMTHSYQRRSYQITQLPTLFKHFKALLYFWKKHHITIFD
ncbi:glycosyltransferase family 2 protein [Carboxylicivirga marina]|uniref:glycosyltransferase family 2 protein n=1 Tax=Carboxylicivirga marina TaxID=2800988 RepID=UPI00259A7C6C|nr:glycosyltransferase family 2 protein [uncultured Carboxylicivirga sp.]